MWRRISSSCLSWKPINKKQETDKYIPEVKETSLIPKKNPGLSGIKIIIKTTGVNLPLNMKKALFLLAALILAFPLYAQDLGEGKVMVVINMSGAKIYESPTFASPTLNVMPMGAILLVEERIGSEEEQQVGVGFSLSGEWIKSAGTEGFIFSSDLTSRRLKTGLNDHGMPFIDLLGDFTGEEKEKKQVETPGGEFPKVMIHRYYENGTYSYTAWDGCFDHVTEYRGLELHEVYHQLVSDYSLFMSDGSLEMPQFEGKSGNKLKFGSIGASEDLTLELKEDGVVVVSSYDCT